MLRPRVEHAGLGLRLHADGEQRLEPARLPVEQPDLDDIELQQVLRVMKDVALEQIDPLLDAHVGQFCRREIGERLSGLMNGSQLLLFEDRVRDIPHRRHGDGHALHSGVRRDLKVEIPVVGCPQRRTRRAARRERNAERVGVGAQHFRTVHRLKKVETTQVGFAAPDRQTTVGPGDGVVCADKRNAIRQMLQDGRGIALPRQTLAHGGWNWIRHQRLSAHRPPLGPLP